MKRLLLFSLCLVFAGLSFAELAPDPVLPPARYPTPFEGGESLLFRIRWGAITGGYSTLAVKTVDTTTPPSYHIVSEARSTGLVDAFYHVEDRNEAWMDATQPRSLRYEKRLHEGKYRVHETVELDHEKHTFLTKEERFDKNLFEQKEGTIPANVLDVLSSLYYIRTKPLAVGMDYTIDVHSGEKTWPLVIRVKGREQVKVKAGKFDCFILEPLLRESGIFVQKGKKLEVWVTADERHMPVLMRSEVFIGHVSAELVSHQSPPGPHPSTQPKLTSGRLGH